MPNHVTNHVIVTGPKADVAQFRTACFTADQTGAERFDFETLIPMPEILHGTISGGGVEETLLAMGHADAVERGRRKFWLKPRSLESMLEWPWVKEQGLTTVDALKAYLLSETRAEAIAQATKSLRAYEATGYLDWYEWACVEWGTKWNAYETQIVSDQPGRLEFRFDTAWSCPKPIFAAIGQRFPSLKLEIASFDEGWNFAIVGHVEGDECQIKSTPATTQMYQAVHGYAPDFGDDDGE